MLFESVASSMMTWESATCTSLEYKYGDKTLFGLCHYVFRCGMRWSLR